MRILLFAFLWTSAFALSPEWLSKGFAVETPTANCSTQQRYQGCVVRSGGKIMLIDAQNRDYILVSSDRSLENYIGQEVQLCATSIIRKDPASKDPGIDPQPPPGDLLTLNVGNVQKVSDKCISPKSTDKK
ncbi:MAG TPA: hypothetical protein VL156_03330 [Terriglobales bacterium]|jgi:hypothetical protein|nr:hypothetical protein [Terriglobales bacterium]